MTETLEFRKQRMTEGLIEYYSQKPAKRWMEALLSYQSTKEKARENHEPLPPDGLNIKYDLKGALMYCAPFLLVIMLTVIQMIADKNAGLDEESAFGFFVIIAGGFLFYFKRFNRKSQLIINKEGISYPKKDLLVRWDDLIASYIMGENYDGDSHRYVLLLHYYSEENDEFNEQAIKLNELDHKPGMIADSIEFLKARAKNDHFK